MDARAFGIKMAVEVPGAGAAAAVSAANAARPAAAPAPPQPITVPGAAMAAPAGMPKLDIQPPAPPPSAGPAMPHQPGDPALAQPIPARKSIHDLPNNPEMERRWAAQQAKVDARTRLSAARANFGKQPNFGPQEQFTAPTPPPAPAATGLAGMGKGAAAFGAAVASLPEKSAFLLPLTAGAIGGAALAPQGHRMEGFGRGAIRGLGTGTGMTAGTFGGSAAGAGLAALLSKLIDGRVNPDATAIGALGGGALGAAGGAYGGYKATGAMMGPASWEKEKPAKKPAAKKPATKAAGAAEIQIRKPVSRTTKQSKPDVNKWATGHQYQGSKMQKCGAGDSILDNVLNNPATPYVAGAGLGAAGGLGIHELIAALRDRYTGQAEPPEERTLGRMGAMGAGTGLGLLTAARGMGKLGAAAEFGTKLAAMDEGMAAGARAVTVRNVKPVTRNEWTGSHKDMTKRLAEACS